jgi:branched-chain amino acid transport system permease protein
MNLRMSAAWRVLRVVGWLAVVGVALLLTSIVSSSQPFVGTIIATSAAYALAATGLDVIVGWLREVSVGQAATMGIGAYAGARLIEHHVLLAFVCSAVGGAVAGLVVGLPASRVHGFALATYTLVIGLAIQLALAVIPGYGGLSGETLVPGSLLGIDLSGSNLPVVAVAMLAIAILAYQILKTSLVGHAWRGIGQNPQMAASLAANPISARMVAFGVAGFAGGVAGMLVSVVTGYLAPSSFTFLLSVQLLAMVVIGGRVHPFGPAVGAAIFALYQRYVPASTWDDAILGGALALSVWLAPRGLAVYVSLGFEKLRQLVWVAQARPTDSNTPPAAVDHLNDATVSSVGQQGD